MLRNRRRENWLRLLICFTVLFWAGCRNDVSSFDPATATFAGQYPIKVVCTTGPVTDMLRELGGEHMQVTGLMGPGVDPHLYNQLPADRRLLRAADMIFYNGLHLEGRMTEVFKELGERKRTVAVTEELEEAKDARLRTPPEFAGYYDPHVWHDPELWAVCVTFVITVLCEFDPPHRDDYERNGHAYLAKVRAAAEYCRTQLATIPSEQRVLVSAHDAFGYFCLAYGLTGKPLKGISTEDEVSMGRMDEVIEFLVAHKVKAVFVESAVKPETVQSLVEQCRSKGHALRIGGELYADALGSPESGADNYLGMIKANVDTIVRALK